MSVSREKSVLVPLTLPLSPILSFGPALGCVAWRVERASLGALWSACQGAAGPTPRRRLVAVLAPTLSSRWWGGARCAPSNTPGRSVIGVSNGGAAQDSPSVGVALVSSASKEVPVLETLVMPPPSRRSAA